MLSASVARTPSKKPFLLGLIGTVLVMQATILPILFVVFVFLPPESPVRYNGVEVQLGEVRLQSLGMIAVWFAFVAYVGPGLRRGKAMARNAAFGALVVGAVAELARTVVVMHDRSALLVAVGYVVVANLIQCTIAGWYLYLKPNVREFFEQGSGNSVDAA